MLNDPGKPGENGTDESFDGSSRDACLSSSGSVCAAKPPPKASPSCKQWMLSMVSIAKNGAHPAHGVRYEHVAG